MSLHLAPANLETDAPRIAELLSSAADHVVTLQHLDLWQRAAPRGRIHLMTVAVEGGAIVGLSDTGRDPKMPHGTYWIDIVVAQERTGNGIGTLLFEDALDFVRELGATRINAEPRANRCKSVRFATQHGFQAHAGAYTRDLTLGSARVLTHRQPEYAQEGCFFLLDCASVGTISRR